ncbi:uncharacterized protein tex12 isoform X2 [Gouania willdenowi]|uniref:uncharacterized protein tex12 isoform X2 n=1 Tax=Gouania willdenowi TaxID=441366 RepID=UPI00105629EA|nr:testis-expressed protein 12 isoform X2 [Gouania willdenowi]
MNEMTPTVEKLMPHALKKTTVDIIRDPKRTMAPEVQTKQIECMLSPSKKKKPPVPGPDPVPVESSAPSFQATAADASAELSVLLSKYAEMLSDRAAADSCQMKDLEGILSEAQHLESHLQEKKSQLKQTLALISDKLQG